MNPPTTTHPEPRDPLAVSLPPRTLQIPLTSEQSERLATAGQGAFQIISRQSYPGDPSRWILTVAPVEWKTAVDASRVLLGTMRAVKISKPTASNVAQTAAMLAAPPPRGNPTAAI